MESKRDINDMSNIAREILTYLAKNPNARDTFEGIIEWWLREQQIKREMSQVKVTLTDLVDRGLIVEQKQRDGRSHYHINQERFQEIQMLLTRSK